tara:strand:+ start:14857 stop:16782 length:1926 start_codon:yes stop_codon:yes gene_type:complete
MKKLDQNNIQTLIKLLKAGQLIKVENMVIDLLNKYPNESILYNIIATSLRKQNKFNEAIEKYEKTIELDYKNLSALNNLAGTYAIIGETDKAIEYYNKLLKLKPDHAEAYNNLATIFAGKGNIKSSIENYKIALNIKPNYLDALNNLGFILKSIGKINEASKYYDKAFKIDSKDIRYAINASLLLPPITESIKSIKLSRENYLKGLKNLKKYKLTLLETGNIILPQTFFLSYHAKNNLNLARNTAKLYKKIIPSVSYSKKRKEETNKKIKIGFISQFLTDHTIGKLFGGLIKNLNKQKFEIIIFHNLLTKLSKTKIEIDNSANKVILLKSNLIDQQSQIIEENLDILFFTDIGMSSITYFLALSRFAPVQVVTWGHPETTGMDTIDYFLSSTLLETKFSNKNYSEKLICLKDFPIFYELPKKIKLFKRKDLNLPEKTRLYGCPQSLYKLHPNFDSILAKILEKDSDSFIVFIGGKGIIEYWIKTLKNRWSKNFPIINEKVIFTKRLSLNEFISFCSCVDVLLDPIYFGGGNTFLESMAVGTPSITMPNSYLRSNITSAAYKQMKIKDPPIVNNSNEYVNLAINLAKNKKKNLKMRKDSVLASKKNLFKNYKALQQFEIFLEKAYLKSQSRKTLNDGYVIKI